MKSKILFLVAICTLTVLSCDDELDLQPLDSITVDAFYNTRGDFDGAIFAAYSSIQDFWGTSTETLSERGEFWKLSMVITDDVAADPVTSDQISIDVDNLQLRAADVPYAAVYTQIYEGIYRTNLVLENLDGENELTAEDKTVLEAEAKFLRGWFHFQAMKMFGTPPLALEVFTDINNLAQPNATTDDLYTTILGDLGTAASGLPDSWGPSDTGRATSWAATALIGKVNVFREDWGAATTALADVVNNGPFSLVPNYEDVFAFNNENNSESIFEVQYGGPQSDDNLWVFDDTHSENFKASQGTGRGWYWDASNGAPGGKLGWWAPTQDLVDSFEAGDTRLPTILYQDGDMYFTTFTSLPYDTEWSSTNYTLKKYRGEINTVPGNHAPNNQADFNNERWMRLAEVKLLYAEALIRGGGDLAVARTQIDDIRTRAGLAATTAADGDLLTAMMQEKRVELALEPHRWFDIVRWDLGPTIFGGDWDPRYEVFPFPQSEVDRSDGQLNQNTGY